MAGTNGTQCASMNGTDIDMSDSRKRPLDEDGETGDTKRTNHGTGCDGGDLRLVGERHTIEPDPDDMTTESIHLKVLVPSVAAGAIIGKGGDTIAQIQKEACARVKMSKANDFYPGTSERVCLIMGSVEAVLQVNNFIMEKIREKPELAKVEAEKSASERHKQVKILVPNSTAGMIIGKLGKFITQIKEKSGAYVQISQKSKDTNLPERCVTIAGDIESNKVAVDMIVEKISEDPQSGSCPNISYADFTGPVASANPTGSPFANPNQFNSPNRNMEGGMFGGQHSGASNAISNFGTPFSLTNSSGGGGFSNMNMGSGMSPTAIESVKATLRSNGYNEQATDEISMAMNTLASYGILGMGMAGNNMSQYPSPNQPQIAAPPNQMGLASSQGQSNAAASSYMNTTPTSTNMSLFGPVGSGSSGFGTSGGATGVSTSLFSNSSPGLAAADQPYNAVQTAESMSGPSTYPGGFTSPGSGTSQNPDPSQNQNSFGLGTGMQYTSNDDVNSGKREIEVPESIVGAILGPGGMGILKLQAASSTNIQISKKGVYAPGTRNRVVTITGPANCAMNAVYLIQQRIQQEEMKRAAQSGSR